MAYASLPFSYDKNAKKADFKGFVKHQRELDVFKEIHSDNIKEKGYNVISLNCPPKGAKGSEKEIFTKYEGRRPLSKNPAI